MIKKITLDNFFSFKNETIELNSGVNILVGINGSGKSNFIRAINLLYNSVIGKGFESTFLKLWGGFDNVANFGKTQSDYIKITYEFDYQSVNNITFGVGYTFKRNIFYEITIHKHGNTSYYLEEKIYIDKDYEHKRPRIYLNMKNGKGTIKSLKEGFEFYPKKDDEVLFKTHELILNQISDPNNYYVLFSLKKAIEELIVYENFDTTFKSRLRQPGYLGTDKRLLPNGENLAQILNDIKNNHISEFEKIQHIIKKISPNYNQIDFKYINSSLYLVLKEEKLNKLIGTQFISDGTLQFMLLLAIFYNPENSGLNCIDEPEIGLHPDMINTIANAIKDKASNGSQLIVATHSPLLLNSFELNDILVFEKNDNNNSTVSHKNEDDFTEWDENFLVGQMWLRGELGGKRW